MQKQFIVSLMKFAIFPTGVLLFLNTLLSAQALPIAIDSRFDDWTAEAVEVTDPNDDGDDLELLRMQVANDEEHLFIRLQLQEEINLIDNQKLTLYLDTDLDNSTGTIIEGIGADVIVRLGEQEVFYQLPSGQGYMSLNDIQFFHQPSVTSSQFEMAFRLDALSNAGFPLFNAAGVRLLWKDEAGPFGDVFPVSNNLFTYYFDNTPIPALEPITLNKLSPKAIRILTWNTLQNGLDDIDREPYFISVLRAVQPDIVTFNECWDINAFQVASFMNGAIPIPGFQNWQAVKLDNGNVTVSRFPILENWLLLPGQRLTASLIDIPSEVSASDLLVVNAHFRCCENDYQRQREADAFVRFIQDAKSPGGVIDLPDNTPFILSGDLNLVGDRQQLETLLTGEIINTDLFGSGGPMDWDEGDLTDVISWHTNQRFAYTWQNPYSDFPPSRIDYQIVSGSALEIEKSFVVETQSMTDEQLAIYNLGKYDTRLASDHLPKAMDVVLSEPVSVATTLPTTNIQLYPNPASNTCYLEWSSNNDQEVTFYLSTLEGQPLKHWQRYFPAGKQLTTIDISNYPPGSYQITIQAKEGEQTFHLIKK